MTEHKNLRDSDEQDLMREAESIGQIYRNGREPPPAALRAQIEARVARDLVQPSPSRPATRWKRNRAWALAASLAFAAILAGQLYAPHREQLDGIALPSDMPPELNDLLRTRGGVSTDEYVNGIGARLSLARQTDGSLQATLFAASRDAPPLLAGVAIPKDGILILKSGNSAPVSCQLEMHPEGRDMIVKAQGCDNDIAAAASDSHFHGQAKPQP